MAAVKARAAKPNTGTPDWGVTVVPAPTASPEPPGGGDGCAESPELCAPGGGQEQAAKGATPSPSPSPAPAGNEGRKLVQFGQLAPGVLSPLLRWTGEQGDKLELFGVSSLEGKVASLEDAQWYSRLQLSVNDVTLLNVSRGEGGFGQMEVDVRGRRIPGAEGQLATEVSSEGLVQATLSLRKHVRAWTHRQSTGVNIGHGWGQLLAIDAPAFRFAIESKPASARQYADATEQMAHGHLSLRFEPAELPAAAAGLIAELAASSAELAASSGEVSSGARSSRLLNVKVAGLMQRREEKRAARSTSLASASSRKQQQQESSRTQQQQGQQQERSQKVAVVVAESAEERGRRFAAMRMRPRAELAAQALVKPVATKRAAKTLALAQRTAAQQRAELRYAERAAQKQQQRHAAPVAALQPASDLPPPSDPRPKRRGWDQPPEAVALVSATEAARPLVLQEAEESAKESAEERGRRFAAMRMRPRAELAGSSSDK